MNVMADALGSDHSLDKVESFLDSKHPVVRICRCLDSLAVHSSQFADLVVRKLRVCDMLPRLMISTIS
jgi:hypothetical protein